MRPSETTPIAQGAVFLIKGSGAKGMRALGVVMFGLSG
jgi:hypothetical protein